MDFVFTNENYNYTAPSAFITTPARRALGLTGSADYPAPPAQAGADRCPAEWVVEHPLGMTATEPCWLRAATPTTTAGIPASLGCRCC
mgnify:CR=1 FL=1